MLPDPADARARMTPRVKAIALATPNNPTGAEYPAELVAEFAEIARANGAVLILDETYRDFDSREPPPHRLFADPGWRDHFVHLYSFSKSFRLTGHRTGAIVASAARLAEAEKVLDTVTICPPQLGQKAALWGLRNLGDWLAARARRDPPPPRRRPRRPLRPPRLARPRLRRLLRLRRAPPPPPLRRARPAPRPRALAADAPRHDVRAHRSRKAATAAPERQLRIAFANVGVEGLRTLGQRLATLGPVTA